MEFIGPYHIESEIGHGGMGVVYRATDPVIGRLVAIKTIRFNEADPEELQTRERFLREARAGGILSHPGIVTVHQVGEDQGRVFIVMEFVEGLSLEGRLEDDEPLDRQTALNYLHDVAAALDYAHGRGIVHRDIKPANLLLRTDGVMKIADFGIARVTGATTITQTGAAIGTPHYMSPEQVQGQTLDGRSDQFSLAVIAYRILAGRRPFDAESVSAVLAKILMAEPDFAWIAAQGLEPSVQRVLERALAKEPGSRYATCAEFSAALNAACAERPRQPEKRSVTTKPARRSTLPSFAMPAGAAVLVVAGALYWWPRLAPSRSTPSLLTAPLSASHPEPTTTTLPAQPNPAPSSPGTPIPKHVPKKSGGAEAPVKMESVPVISENRHSEPRGGAAPAWAMSRGPQGNGYAPVLGPRQPHVQWDFQAQAELRGAVAVGGDGTAYFGDLSRNLYALGADHQVRWSHAAAGRILVTPAILRDGLIIFADMDGGIYGLNPEGTVVWTSKVGASPAAPVVWNGKILIQSRTGKYCLDGNTGSIVWQGAGGSGNPFSPVIADGIMLVSDGAQLQALDASTGQIRWSADLSDEVAQSPALDANGLAYIATRDSVLHCLDRQGHERWQYRSQAHITTSPAVHSSGGILFGSADRSVSLVREGELRWKFPTGSICSDPVTARDGAVYFGCQDGALYGVNSAGQQEWKRDLTGEIRGSAIALSQDGALFVSTINRRLFRIAD